MELYPFNALLARMKYIARWGLMRAARTESLSEHTADAAILAHTLCLVSQTIFGTDVRPETVAVAALYHDASEILTGDMPTPVKYKSEPLRAAFRRGAAARLSAVFSAFPAEAPTRARSHGPGP